MGYDAMANNASAPALIARDLAKKKRGNRSAKLKQCKLDARREQWLSQVKSPKDGKSAGTDGGSPTVTSPSPHPPLPRAGKGNLEVRRREEERDRDDAGLLQEMSDLDSPTQSPTSSASGNASQKGCLNNISSSGSSAESSSRSVSDAEEEPDGREEENGVLDDWEAVADALSTGDDHSREDPDPAAAVADPMPSVGATHAPSCSAAKKSEPVRTNPRAWRPDDAFRPQSLPSISKQRSFPASMERQWGGGVSQKGILSLPSSCPICYEDLDPTDSSFLPCSCGFRLCLFCHKRILEADGRCPGCRKQYDAVPGGGMDVNGGGVPILPLRLARSCSMSSRY
ncbi:uncharacterized protein [Typha latifolia]|uniref:uncharacterized protein n=1 Tax=Typha latifolia TaxID=4733 RepID=UPI003C2B91A3